MSGLQIYKPTQGKYTRMTTVLTIVVLGAWGCFSLSQTLRGLAVNIILAWLIPLGILVGIGLFMLWLVNRPKTADFMIATEGEMKKVSWSSKKEVIGSTKVVIVTTFLLAAILFLVDIVFTHLFRMLGVMGK